MCCTLHYGFIIHFSHLIYVLSFYFILFFPFWHISFTPHVYYDRQGHHCVFFRSNPLQFILLLSVHYFFTSFLSFYYRIHIHLTPASFHGFFTHCSPFFWVDHILYSTLLPHHLFFFPSHTFYMYVHTSYTHSHQYIIHSLHTTYSIGTSLYTWFLFSFNVISLFIF